VFLVQSARGYPGIGGIPLYSTDATSSSGGCRTKWAGNRPAAAAMTGLTRWSAAVFALAALGNLPDLLVACWPLRSCGGQDVRIHPDAHACSRRRAIRKTAAAVKILSRPFFFSLRF